MSEHGRIAAAAAERQRERMREALEYLWAHPETGYKEWKSSAWLEKAYEDLGYSLTRAGDIPGFTAEMDTGIPGPRILVFSELDSVICRDHPDCDPETGAVHACGHCAQGAALLGVAAAIREPEVLEGLCGSVRFAVVPAEELVEVGWREELRRKGVIRYFGGKPEFLRRGLLDGCDAAFMIHTGGGKHSFGAPVGGNGWIAKTVTYVGKAAHAGGSPHLGINALYAAEVGMAAVNALRETFRDDDHIRVHPIITKGGDIVNAIPGSVRLESYVRGATVEAIADANRKVNRALAGAALALGADVELCDRPGYLPVANDRTLLELFARAAGEIVPAENVRIDRPFDTGCTDMGDISCVMPAIHAFGCGAEGAGHGADYRIVDFDSAVADSAKVQLTLLRMLLCDGGREAKRVIDNATPVFPDREKYFEAQDGFTITKRAVVYENGGARVSWEA